VLISCRNRDSSILASLATFEAQSRQLGADMEINISSMKDEIVATLELLGDEFQRQLKEGTRENLTSVQNPASITTLSNKLSNFATRGNDTSTSFRFLKSLRFRAMEVRHSSITEAHEKTLEWLFSKKYNFIQWLQSTGQIFWISGKPGSGKSTLLKFLVDNARMKTALKAWAGANTLVTASFFFWIAGTDMQKSQEGLLRSLLFQILKKHPQLMPATFPAQWQSLRSSHTDSELVIWSRKELLDGFERLKNNQFSSARFFFVIDGLDEYEGDHTDLLDVLDGLMSSMNVKICLSSRPWNVFEAAFGDQQMQKLYMEDFNRADIQLYVQDRLERRSEFQNFAQDHAWAKKVVEEIVEKSKGVFLWVYLVVRSLVQGLINHDRVMDLQKRLLDFPSDLDAFFRQIFTSLDPVYRIQTARTFQVALANRGPLSLLNYWFLDCEEEDPQFSLAMTPVALPQTDVRKREDIMRKRLNARCKGLVQFETRNKVKSFAADSTPLERGQSEFEVEFLHRTVKDFLMTEDMQKMIANWLDSSFNPNLTICRTLLAELKSVSPYYFSVAEDVVPISSP
jgi:hypothetical protein